MFPFSFEPFLSRHVAVVLKYHVVGITPQRSVVRFEHPVVFCFEARVEAKRAVQVVTEVWLLCVSWSAASSTCSEGQFSGSGQTSVVSLLVGIRPRPHARNVTPVATSQDVFVAFMCARNTAPSK